MLSKEHADILAGIQEALLENERDRIDVSCQAAPVYYGIIDREKIVVPEGHHDLVEYYDADNCCALDDEEIRQRIDEYMEITGDGDRDHAEAHWHEAFDEIEAMHMAYRRFLVPDRMFLTRAEADAHLEANRYHYTDWAHSYAMTAWRSPQVERLIEVLHAADFSVEGGDAR